MRWSCSWEGQEEPLDDEKRLTSAEKVPLFMLPKEGVGWAGAGAFVLHKSCGGADWERKDGWVTDAGLGEWERASSWIRTRMRGAG
jgi:hypothetical protein